MPKNKLINLLPQEEFDASITGRILKWAMGTFRIIVIVTEMVVMGAFLSRFWLDAQNSDLTEEMNFRKAQIETQGNFEKEFRQVQTKLSIFKQLAEITTPVTRINSVTSKLPVDVVLSSISLTETSAQIKGVAGSELGVAQFISNLKGEKSFKKADLNSIGSSEEDPSLITFTINVSY